MSVEVELHGAGAIIEGVGTIVAILEYNNFGQVAEKLYQV